MAQRVLVCFVIMILSIPISVKCDDEEEEFEFLFDGFNGSNNINISVNGTAGIEPNGLLWLTNSTYGLMGHAFYSTPIKFKNSTTGKAFSFSTAFAFAIFDWYEDPNGLCFAFSVSPSKELPSQHLHRINRDYFSLFSLKISVMQRVTNPDSDTLSRLEYIPDFFYAVFNDQRYRLDLNFTTLKSNAAHVIRTQFGDGVLIQAWLDYDSTNNQLEIRLSPTSSKPLLPILSQTLDLSPILNQTIYVGFSASTTVLDNRQYIAGWSFKLNGQATSLDLQKLLSLLPVLIIRNMPLKTSRYICRKTLLYFLAFSIILVLVFLLVILNLNKNNDRFKSK